MSQNDVARRLGVHRNTIGSLWRRYQQNGNVRDQPRSGRPRVTTRRQDNHIRLVHLRNRFRTSSLTACSIPGLRRISSRTVRNRLRELNIRARRPAIRPVLLQRHHNARLDWCRRRLRLRQQDWANMLFTDESRVHLDSNDGRSRGISTASGKIQRLLCDTTQCFRRRQRYGMGRDNDPPQDTPCDHQWEFDRHSVSGRDYQTARHAVYPDSWTSDNATTG